MSGTRVLLAVDSPLFRDLLRNRIAREDHMDVVGDVADPMDLLLAVRRTGANVLIHSWPDSEEMPGICSHLLLEYPALAVIGIPPDAERAYSCRQTITTTIVEMDGLRGLLDEIRLVSRLVKRETLQ